MQQFLISNQHKIEGKFSRQRGLDPAPDPVLKKSWIWIRFALRGWIRIWFVLRGWIRIRIQIKCHLRLV